jgi:hypothetical protein
MMPEDNKPNLCPSCGQPREATSGDHRVGPTGRICRYQPTDNPDVLHDDDVPLQSYSLEIASGPVTDPHKQLREQLLALGPPRPIQEHINKLLAEQHTIVGHVLPDLEPEQTSAFSVIVDRGAVAHYVNGRRIAETIVLTMEPYNEKLARAAEVTIEEYEGRFEVLAYDAESGRLTIRRKDLSKRETPKVTQNFDRVLRLGSAKQAEDVVPEPPRAFKKGSFFPPESVAGGRRKHNRNPGRKHR